MALVYSCCFWFSLRLGGILIGIFSLLQALLILIASCLGYSQSQSITDEITNWTNKLNLIYTKDYLDNIKLDPEKYLSLSISFTCVYIIVCILFIYGAYTCNNMLMVSYILIELLRLALISILVATSLLLIKKNTMDIGLLIGASVAGGFFLLGMFYLWICVANLPILISEMEHDEQTAVINKLRQLVEINNQSSGYRGLDNIPLAADTGDTVNRDVFIAPRNKEHELKSRSRLPIKHFNNFY